MSLILYCLCLFVPQICQAYDYNGDGSESSKVQIQAGDNSSPFDHIDACIKKARDLASAGKTEDAMNAYNEGLDQLDVFFKSRSLDFRTKRKAFSNQEVDECIKRKSDIYRDMAKLNYVSGNYRDVAFCMTRAINACLVFRDQPYGKDQLLADYKYLAEIQIFNKSYLGAVGTLDSMARLQADNPKEAAACYEKMACCYDKMNETAQAKKVRAKAAKLRELLP